MQICAERGIDMPREILIWATGFIGRVDHVMCMLAMLRLIIRLERIKMPACLVISATSSLLAPSRWLA